MDRAKQREIASKGGKAAHEKGTAHRFTAEEARAAGRKGGQAAHVKGTAHEFTSEEARAAGRKGGQAARDRGRENRETSENRVPFNGQHEVKNPNTPAAQRGADTGHGNGGTGSPAAAGNDHHADRSSPTGAEVVGAPGS
jgi:general stress protein YciG